MDEERLRGLAKGRMRSYDDPAADGEEIRFTTPTFLPEAEHKLFRRTRPKVCVDIVALCRLPNGKIDKALWLPKRTLLPKLGVWWFGGGYDVNDDTYKDAAVRLFKEEAGWTLNPEMLFRINGEDEPIRYTWKETPEGGPGKDVVVAMYAYVFSGEELEQIGRSVSPKEYDTSFGVQRFDRKRLEDEGDHPVLFDIFYDFFPPEEEAKESAAA